MGVVLATCQVPGTPAEQEQHAYAVPFFPLGSVFLPSEESVLPAGWMAPIPEVLLGIRHKSYGLTQIYLMNFINLNVFIYSHREVSP